MDDKITFWDVATHRQLGQPLGGDNGASLSKDFETVALDGKDSIVLQDVSFITDATRESWQARACERANRNLTHAEWTNYFGNQHYRATCPSLPLDEDAAPKVASSSQ